MLLKPEDIPVTALREAAGRPEVVAAVRQLYDEADRRIAAQSPVCWNKGECCRFGQFGHRLYVTALEVVYYLATAEQCASPEGEARVTEDACPHARDGKCHARPRRPLGCRVFYCDPAAQHWQGPLTEEMLARLQRLHEELQVPYFYADWMTVLRALATR
jgi:hypothetical protein